MRCVPVGGCGTCHWAVQRVVRLGHLGRRMVHVRRAAWVAGFVLPSGVLAALGGVGLREEPVGAAALDSGTYVIGADGAGARRIARSESGFSWSPDGSQIALVAGAGLNSDVLTVSVADGKARRLLRAPHLNEYDVAWSPDGTRIAFAASNSREETFRGRIWVVNNDGTAPRRLSPLEDPEERALRWSPDSRKLVFVRSREQTSVMTMAATGGSRARLTRSWGSDECPTWSPDGRQIAFLHDAAPEGEGGYAVWVMTSDGTRRRMLLPAPRTTQLPQCLSWAPDGRRLAASNGWIWTMTPDGSDKRRLTIGRNPAWSPNGQRIAFVRHHGGRQSELYVIDIDGTHVTRLTRTPASEDWPAWSPDGKLIAFVRF